MKLFGFTDISGIVSVHAESAMAHKGYCLFYEVATTLQVLKFIPIYAYTG